MVRLVAAVLIASAALSACKNGSEQNTPMPPTTTIWMEERFYAPRGSTVEVGKKLTWVNKDDVPHDVDFTSGGSFQSDPVGKGETIKYTPRAAGRITYVCSVHPSMTGTLRVE